MGLSSRDKFDFVIHDPLLRKDPSKLPGHHVFELLHYLSNIVRDFY